jgi:hypothetical protein
VPSGATHDNGMYHARDCAGRKPTETVSLQPFEAQCSNETPAVFFLNLHSYLPSTAVRIGRFSTARPILHPPTQARRDALFTQARAFRLPHLL